ncbi:ABC transporter substrate-binding protein [Micromonospora sp. SL1-18]|uniref:ABC transporter substrate-binding protein n=1 Tax=Micromonospora sp. SL1-18 TaxID=3399128 RepID=UPI003A4E3B42
MTFEPRRYVRAAAAVAAVLLTTGLGACASGGSGSVSVLVPWTEDEKDQFRAVLDKFEEHNPDIKVRYTGSRAVSEVLASAVQRGSPPDIAVLSSPGELASYVGYGLKPLDTVLEAPATRSEQWQTLEKLGTDQQYGLTIKADLKSLIWYRTDQFPKRPSNWSDFKGKPWCLGMEATPASGWPGTDWVEDLLLHPPDANGSTDPKLATDTYRQWASGAMRWSDPSVSRAWKAWGDRLTASGAVPGGLSTALLTNFGKADRDLADPDRAGRTPQCAANHQGSFALAGYPANAVDVVPFPDSSGGPGRRWEVSANLAGMFNNTEPARKLLRYLASDEAQQIWPQNSRGTVFSVNKFERAGPDAVYTTPASRNIAAVLAGVACDDGPDWCGHPDQATLCFDASDLMPPAVTAALYRTIVEYLIGLDSRRTAPPEHLLSRLDTVRLAALRDSGGTASGGTATRKYWWDPATVCAEPR